MGKIISFPVFNILFLKINFEQLQRNNCKRSFIYQWLWSRRDNSISYNLIPFPVLSSLVKMRNIFQKRFLNQRPANRRNSLIAHWNNLISCFETFLWAPLLKLEIFCTRRFFNWGLEVGEIIPYPSYIWLSVAISRYIWLFLVYLCLSLAISGYLWLSLAILRFLWLYLEIFYYIWRSSTISGDLLLYLTILGYLWLSHTISCYQELSHAISWDLKLSPGISSYLELSRALVISGYIRRSWTISGYIRLSLAISGYLWLSLAISDYL